MPGADLLAEYDTAEPNAKKESRSAPGRSTNTTRVRKTETLESFFHGVGDSVTFGFLDEAGGFIDALGLTDGRTNIWNSDRSFSALWDENTDKNRELMGQMEEEHGTAFFSGQMAGALVPIGGKALNGLKSTKGLRGAELAAARSANLRSMALSGSVFGGAYGIGSADGDFEDRLIGGVNGAFTGAIGGYVLGAITTKAIPALWERGKPFLFKQGKAVELTDSILPKAVNLTDEAPTPGLKAKVKDPVGMDTSVKLGTPIKPGSITDDLPEGALLTARELIGEPGAAKAALTKRIGKLSPQEAQRLYHKIAEAEANGDVAQTHYQSLLGIDLENTKLNADDVVRAAELFEEATEKLAERAGLGTKTVRGMEAEVGKEIAKGVTLGDLEDAFEVGKRGFVKTRIAQHVMLTSTAKVIRLRSELMPKVLAGDTAAKEQLAEQLTDAAHRFVLARGILSNAGRALGILAHGTKAKTIEVVDDIFEVEGAEAIGKRIRAALGELDDTAVAELLNGVRTLDDGSKILDILMDPVEAKAYGVWARTLQTVGAFLRSNALTPATALFNTAGFVINDFFRNDMARSKLVRSMMREGRIDEGLALQLELQVARSVYWRAQKEGLKALMRRVKWEWWSDVEQIAGVGWGSGRVAEKARLKRGTMLADGFVPPQLREFKEKPRLAVTDIERFNAENEAARAARGDTAFANIVFHLNKARAVAANTLDAGGTAAMKLFTGAIDDWGREFVRYKETFAESARFAVREAMEANVHPDDMAEYVQKRAKELATLPTADLMGRVEAALVTEGDLRGEAEFLAHLGKRITEEEDRVLFMDGPQTALGKSSANFLSGVDKIGLVLPYVRTPIRLFEQGVVTHGPFGMKSAEVQKILARAASPSATADDKLAAELTKARVEIGGAVFDIGLTLGLAGGVTATNGGFDNSANLDQGPAQRVNLPGGYYIEYGRADPFAFTVGMGALLGQALREGFAAGTEYDQMEAFKAGLHSAVMGAFDSVLSKSYLKGLQDLLDLADMKDPEQWASNVSRIAANASARLIPLAGVGKQINETFAGQVEAATFMDNILRHIPGAAWSMSPKVDVFGDEVKDRVVGLQVGNSETTNGEPISDVKRQLRELGININTLRKSDPDGFDLNSEELTEARIIRGKEAVNEDGLTMPEALGELFADPWFQSLPSKDQKRAEVIETMRAFNKPTWELLTERSPTYASKKEYTRSLADYLDQGMARSEAKSATLQDLEAAGLPEPDL